MLCGVVGASSEEAGACLRLRDPAGRPNGRLPRDLSFALNTAESLFKLGRLVLLVSSLSGRTDSKSSSAYSRAASSDVLDVDVVKNEFPKTFALRPPLAS